MFSWPCRLVANAYLMLVTHLTTGMRVGAAAAEKLHLFPVSTFVRLAPMSAHACKGDAIARQLLAYVTESDTLRLNADEPRPY